MITNKLITTRELTRVSGFSSASLKKYADLGWLPEPVLKSYKHGGGSSLWWSRSCLVRLASIRSMKKAGFTNDKIDEFFSKGDN
jgi:hypothetical protein